MARRTYNDTFLDKFLGLFGITRPKKRRKAVSKRKNAGRNEVRNDFKVPLNDDFMIVQQANTDNTRSRTNTSNKRRPNTSANRNPKKSNKAPKKRRPVLNALLSVFLVIVITVCLVGGSAVFYFLCIMSPSDSIQDPSNNLYNLKLQYTSILYATDSEGNEVELKRLHGDQNRLWVDSDDIPDNVKNAFISCEDKRFESHSGVDWKRTFSAGVNMFFKIYSSKQGGSTITQQLIKNITDKNNAADRTWQVKLQEIKDALYVESNYDKETILECYLNTIHLGYGVDGVEVASNYYFDKNVSDLTLVQAACLASITKDPTANSPYQNPENNLSRRNWVLEEMYQNGYISKEDCEEAKTADLELRRNPKTTLSTTNTVEEKCNSYFVDAVIDDVIDKLVEEKGYTEEYATEQLYKGGYKIYTTVDLDAQEKLEAVYENEDYFTDEDGKRPQSAMTIMDYEGNVKAIVGGRGKKKENRVLNRATQTPRPTGSSIKPISAYAAAFEYNLITWGTRIKDSPVDSLVSGEVLSESWPKNYSNSYSYENTSISYAIQQSLNTIPVKLIQELTVDTAYEFVTEKMGISTFTENDGNGHTDKCESSLALGGSVYGATTLEMAAAYTTFGNGGMYYEPKTFTKVLDQSNEVILDQTDNKHRAISSGTAAIMCKLLQSVATEGTGKGATFGDWEIMCKTGTSSDNKDRWFIGGTSKYMAACWYGMDNNKKMTHLSPNPAMVLWKAAMSSIHEDLKVEDFKDSDDIEYRKYCTSSGLCARTGCYSTSYGYFKKSYTPFCQLHGGSEIGASSGSDDESYHESEAVSETKTTKTEKASKTEKTKVNTTANKTENKTEKTDATVATTASPPETTSKKHEATKKTHN